jgi:hypothetical protein
MATLAAMHLNQHATLVAGVVSFLPGRLYRYVSFRNWCNTAFFSDLDLTVSLNHRAMASTANDLEDDRQRITRRRGACKLCREKKVRCRSPGQPGTCYTDAEMIGNGLKPCSFCEVCVLIPWIEPHLAKTRSQKHETTCTYQLPAPKPPNHVSGPPSESHSVVTPSPHHTRQLSSADSAVSGLASEQTFDFTHADYPPRSDIAAFDSFDEDLGLVGYGMDISSHDTHPVPETLLLDPLTTFSTANATAFDMQDFDSLFSPGKQGMSLTSRHNLRTSCRLT